MTRFFAMIAHTVYAAVRTDVRPSLNHTDNVGTVL
jgi:hypothetical protein